MSKPVSDSLHRLIKAMTKSEKRYFKLFASRHTHKGKNNYIILFDAIEKQKIYDEIKLRQIFKGQAFLKLFAITKQRLFEIILRSLDGFHSDSSIEAQLNRRMHYAEILFNKVLYQECSQVLSASKKLAYKYEKYSILLDIFKWEKKIMEQVSFLEKNEKEITSLLEEDTLVLQKILNQNKYWNINSRLFLLLYKRGKMRNEKEIAIFNEIINSPLLKDENNALSNEAKYLYNTIYSTYYFGTGNYEDSYKYYLRNFEIATLYPDLFIKQKQMTYIALLTNLVYLAGQLKKYDKVAFYLKKLKDLSQHAAYKKNETLRMEWFMAVSDKELILHIQTGEIEKAFSVIASVEHNLQRYKNKVNKVFIASFYFNAAVVCFSAEQYSNSLKWINKILNDAALTESQDIQCFTRILNLIIHIELGNEELLPYITKSTYRYLHKKNKVYKFETVFLDFIKELLKHKPIKGNVKMYQEFKKDLIALSNIPFEKTVFEYFDFLAWVETKISKTTFTEAVKRKMNNLLTETVNE